MNMAWRTSNSFIRTGLARSWLFPFHGEGLHCQTGSQAWERVAGAHLRFFWSAEFIPPTVDSPRPMRNEFRAPIRILIPCGELFPCRNLPIRGEQARTSAAMNDA